MVFPPPKTDLTRIAAERGKEFIFRLGDGKEIGRASNLAAFLSNIKSVPIESIEYHVRNHHFSPWLRYLKLNDLAQSFDRLSGSGEQLRLDIINLISRL